MNPTDTSPRATRCPWANTPLGIQYHDLEWGVPVPDDIGDGKLKGKVFYVWFDAPIEYIGATKEWSDARGKPDAEWQRWWRPDSPIP